MQLSITVDDPNNGNVFIPLKLRFSETHSAILWQFEMVIRHVSVESVLDRTNFLLHIVATFFWHFSHDYLNHLI